MGRRRGRGRGRLAKERANKGDVAVVEGEHIHPPAQGAVDSRRLKVGIRNRAEVGGAEPRDIIDIAPQGAPEDTAWSVGRPESPKRRPRARGLCGAPPEPRAPGGLAAPDAYRGMGEERSFARRDYGAEFAEMPIGGVLVLAPGRMLAVLTLSDYQFGDWDFSMAPFPIREIYIIRSALTGRSVTAAYCLLSRNAKADYEYALRAPVASCAELGALFGAATCEHRLRPRNCSGSTGATGADVQIATRYYICRSRSGKGFRERAFILPTTEIKRHS